MAQNYVFSHTCNDRTAHPKLLKKQNSSVFNIS